MYNKRFLLTIGVIAMVCMSAAAQGIAKNYKETSNGNPISASVFCADPTALEYKGRLYVYGTNDHQEFIANGKKGDNSYGNIKSLVVFSTADMVNWTFHGTIDTKKICASWGNNPWYQGYGVSWAPSVTWRTTAAGTDEFFLYFCNSSHGVGVLKANSPIGPWKSPLKKLMIHYDSPGAFPMNSSANFDPGVVIDDNGVGWISFGGLNDGGQLLPDNARIAKLKPSMTELDGEAVRIPAPYHFEANELNVIDGKYVYTYCSHWTRNNTEWNTYKNKHGINASIPEGGTMCYMVSDNPTDPDSWVYKGAYGPGVGGNNHSHLQKFKDHYYHIYHNHGSVLLDAMKKAGAVDGSAGDYRSICVNEVTVNESTQKISQAKLTIEGVKAICNLNPYELQQAETMATCGGVSYEDFANLGSSEGLGNDASKNLKVKMAKGAWTMVRSVGFGDLGAASFTFRAKGSGTMEIRLGRYNKAAATVNFSSLAFTNHTVELDPATFQGVKNVYFIFTDAENVQFDSWQFFEAAPDGVSVPSAPSPVSTLQSYDVMGRRIPSSAQNTPIVIERYVDQEGVQRVRKYVAPVR